MPLADAWRSLRSLVKEAYSFNGMKDLMGHSGLPIEQLAHLQQRQIGGASKGQLIDGIEGVLNHMTQEDREEIVRRCVTTMLQERPAVRPQVEAALATAGWGLVGNEPQSLALAIDVDLASLPAAAQEGLQTALSRYGQGDLDGAITAICGVVDSLTAEAYAQHGLGNHTDAKYQERVARSFDVKETAYKQALAAHGVPQAEVNILWQNERGAVNQAAYVMARFRSNFSDAHGAQAASREMVQRALDIGTFLTRSLLAH